MRDQNYSWDYKILAKGGFKEILMLPNYVFQGNEIVATKFIVAKRQSKTNDEKVF